MAGALASWWGANLPDLKALAAQDFEGLVESWVATIRDAIESADGASKSDPLGHKLVTRLLAAYLDEVAAADAKKAEIEAQLEAAEKGEEEDEGSADANDAAELTPEQMKALKKDLKDAKAKLKALRKGLLDRLERDAGRLPEEGREQLVLGILRHELASEIERRVAAHRQGVIERVETWWDKYRVTAMSIERDRGIAAATLATHLMDLGYDAR